MSPSSPHDDADDDEIRHLQASGALQEVIGSQSLLSQELQDMTQPDSGSQANKYESSSSLLSTSQPVLMTSKLLLTTQEDPTNTSLSLSQESTLNLFESNNFGTLLDAVELVDPTMTLGQKRSLQENVVNTIRSSTRVKAASNKIKESGWTASAASTATAAAVASTTSPSKKPRREPAARSVAAAALLTPVSALLAASEQNKTPVTAQATGPPVAASPAAPSVAKRSPVPPRSPAKQVAQQAAHVASQVLGDPVVAKNLLLSLTLHQRHAAGGRSKKPPPPPGHTLPESFHWAHYVPLEDILKKNMAEYYWLSVEKCQSMTQHSFNNHLVALVRVACHEWGWSLPYTDKQLRDRVRCYYKTHIQNAKKRLQTMLKNPTKKSNAKHLIEMYDLIEEVVSDGGSTSNKGGNGGVRG